VKRVTVLFDDEALYRSVKAEAAKEGRPVKDVVAEALSGWLQSRGKLSPEDRQRRQEALNSLDEIRAKQPIRNVIDDLLAELREERS